MPQEHPEPDSFADSQRESQSETATLGGGCFWCLEAIFQEVKGVEQVVSGYAGGDVENPTYEQVCSGQTNHAEVIQIQFHSQEISYEELLLIFWNVHDPTTWNRQGNDVGTQYRSVIFTHSDAQAEQAQKLKCELEAQRVFENPIVTEILPVPVFTAAEKYHQNYYRSNANQRYCLYIINPKLEHFRLEFNKHLKET